MVLTKNEKKQIISDLSQKIDKVKSVVFANYSGLKVNDMQQLRKKLKEKNIEFKVVKNKLLEKVLGEKHIDIEKGLLDKPLACAFGLADEVEPAKIIYNFNKEHEKLELLGAILEHKFIDTNQIKSLALLPAKNELYGQIIVRLNSPINGFVNVLKGNLQGLVSVLRQYQNNIR